MRQISLIIILVIGLSTCTQDRAAERGKTQFLDPVLVKAMACPPPVEPTIPPPLIKWTTLRDFCQQIIFPSFQFQGTLGEAVRKLMNESEKLNSEGVAVGGFIFFGQTSELQVKVNATSINAVDLVDLLCSEIAATPRITPYNIVIEPDLAKAKALGVPAE